MAFDREACAAFYAENGYYIHENALTLEEVEMLREDATRICRGNAGAVRGLLPRMSPMSLLVLPWTTQ